MTKEHVMPTRRLFYRRKFLNRPRYHTGAHVIASIELVNDEDRKPCVDASLRLTDCYRVIELDFDVRTRAEARNALHKVTLLRDIVSEYVDALERAVGEWEELRESKQNQQNQQTKQTKQN
jgi:hypothetical protein